jgi:hypothetical protein
VRAWLVRETTATNLTAFRLIGVIFWALAANAVGAQQLKAQDQVTSAQGASVARVLEVLQDHAAAADNLDLGALTAVCPDDPLCLGRELAAANPAEMRLVQAQHPTSDSIRWVTNRPSLGGVTCRVDREENLSILLALAGFGRKLLSEVEAAITACLAANGQGTLDKERRQLILDLRGNGGGDFGRMLKLAAFFLGERKAALSLRRDGFSLHPVDLPAGEHSILRPDAVLVNRETASSAEILAGLLKRYGGARLLGEVTKGKDFISRLVPLDHDWRLLFRAETIEIPGISLSGGLQPDGPLDLALLEQP